MEQSRQVLHLAAACTGLLSLLPLLFLMALVVQSQPWPWPGSVIPGCILGEEDSPNSSKYAGLAGADEVASSG